MGQRQVTKQIGRVERAVAIAVMAYLLFLKLRARELPIDWPWTAFSLQRAFACEVIQVRCERSAH